MAKEAAMIARSLSAMTVFAMLSAASPPSDDHFLSLSRRASLIQSEIEIHVGLRNWPRRRVGEWPRAEDLWFSADDSDGATRRPLKWTDGGRCPAAVAKLREVERLTGPSPRIPLANGEPGGSTVMDGTDYELNVGESVLDGQSVGPFHLSSNVNTSLAKWADAMLAALKPCWSAEKPEGAP
jgi:hypothetical protein